MILDILRVLSWLAATYCIFLSIRVGVQERIVGKANGLSIVVAISAFLYLFANVMYETGGIKVADFVSILYRQDFIIIWFAFLGFQKRRWSEVKNLPVVAINLRDKLSINDDSYNGIDRRKGG